MLDGRHALFHVLSHGGTGLLETFRHGECTLVHMGTTIGHTSKHGIVIQILALAVGRRKRFLCRVQATGGRGRISGITNCCRSKLSHSGSHSKQCIVQMEGKGVSCCCRRSLLGRRCMEEEPLTAYFFQNHVLDRLALRGSVGWWHCFRPDRLERWSRTVLRIPARWNCTFRGGNRAGQQPSSSFRGSTLASFGAKISAPPVSRSSDWKDLMMDWLPVESSLHSPLEETPPSRGTPSVAGTKKWERGR